MYLDCFTAFKHSKQHCKGLQINTKSIANKGKPFPAMLFDSLLWATKKDTPRN